MRGGRISSLLTQLESGLFCYDINSSLQVEKYRYWKMGQYLSTGRFLQHQVY